MWIKSKVNFTDIRIRQGYSVSSLARAMQVSPATVIGIEKQRNVHPATAQKACKALNLSFDELFTISGQGNSDTTKKNLSPFVPKITSKIKERKHR